MKPRPIPPAPDATRAAIQAALRKTGMPPPKGLKISLARWRAMVRQVINNGPPSQFKDWENDR